MKQTTLHDKHLALNAKMIDYAGYDMPVSYAGIQQEHLAVRTGLGIFDVSHMGEFLITGKDALGYVNRLVTNTVTADLSKVTYALMCDEQGFVVDDLLVYVIKPDEILLVVNAGNIDKDWDWVNRHTEGYAVDIRNLSEGFSQIALQGPEAQHSIHAILGVELPDLLFMTFTVIPYGDGHVLVSRTGYTGEDGFEIYGQHDAIRTLWDNATTLGAVPCGLGARDTLRFEANLPLYGHEISESIHPYEAGLGFAIKLDKPFIGRDALAELKDKLSRKIVGLELLEKGIPRHGYPVYHEDTQVGVITTGYLLPNQEKPLALALVDMAYTAIGAALSVQIRNNRVQAKVRNRKFHLKNYKK
ncbi:MAG: glycine cleavage system aminomethyltransferase GcvT [Acholeplasmataceae bacterium]|nr:MAG: glycine cleavage system aminomethyltransferase GcvT [Acholeplasmataceae bacterium]